MLLIQLHCGYSCSTHVSVIPEAERLTRLVLNGPHELNEIRGKQYPDRVPVTSFGGMLKNDDVSAVLTPSCASHSATRPGRVGGMGAAGMGRY